VASAKAKRKKSRLSKISKKTAMAWHAMKKRGVSVSNMAWREKLAENVEEQSKAI
jgi:hypothetical protein